MGRNGFMIREKEGVWHVMDKIAVLIPCFNEGLTIRKVVDDFRKELPNADIYVYDNNSDDDTVEQAQLAGAIVRHEYQQGKGNVVRKMFTEIDADAYVLVDGDDTYPVMQSFGRLVWCTVQKKIWTWQIFVWKAWNQWKKTAIFFL